MRIYLACPACGSDDLTDIPDPERNQNEIQKLFHILPYSYQCQECHQQFKPNQSVGMVMKDDGKVQRLS